MKKPIWALALLALLCVALVFLLGSLDTWRSSGSGGAASPGESGFADATGSAADSPASEELSAPETESGQGGGQDQILFAESLPEGYVLSYGHRYGNGECDFLWRKEGDYMPTVLNLTANRKDDTSKEDWEHQTTPYEQTEREVNGMSIHCYQDDWTSQLLWQLNRTPYSLLSKGPERLTVEELLEIVEGMTLFDEIDPFLTEDDD